MAPIRVGIIGATGETGSSILSALLLDRDFSIISLTRPTSLSSPVNQSLAQTHARNLILRPFDLSLPIPSLVPLLSDIQILISAIGRGQSENLQLPLASAAKLAGVQRFIPCAFGPAMPVGVHQSRDQKEEVFNHVKRLRLPYTIIDVGWWYQISFPPLPSGKIDYAMGFPGRDIIPGDGEVKSALTDLRDVGRYVASIIKDGRTENKMVFVWNECWTRNAICDLMEEMAREKVKRQYRAAEEYEKEIREAEEVLAEDNGDGIARLKKVGAQYALSVDVRGENTPEYAKFLGYLDGKELYPDLEYKGYREYIKEVLNGDAKGVYPQLKQQLENASNARLQV